jgi:hypothetical protein
MLIFVVFYELGSRLDVPSLATQTEQMDRPSESWLSQVGHVAGVGAARDGGSMVVVEVVVVVEVEVEVEGRDEVGMLIAERKEGML